MLAIDALKLMKFQISDYYRVGRQSIEYMSSDSDEMARLETAVGYVSIRITGDASFEYEGKTFKMEEDYDGRDDIIDKLRNEEIIVDDHPWFEVQANDWDNEHLKTDVMEINQLPTKLKIKGMLMDELKSWMDESGIENWLDEEMLALKEVLPHFHATTIKLKSNVRVDTMERIMSDFLVQDENLLSVVGCVEMEAFRDYYDEKWFTMQFYCPSPEGVRLIRQEIMQYGEIW